MNAWTPASTQLQVMALRNRDKFNSFFYVTYDLEIDVYYFQTTHLSSLIPRIYFMQQITGVTYIWQNTVNFKVGLYSSNYTQHYIPLVIDKYTVLYNITESQSLQQANKIFSLGHGLLGYDVVQ
jgi:hypothetical protein